MTSTWFRRWWFHFGSGTANQTVKKVLPGGSTTPEVSKLVKAFLVTSISVDWHVLPEVSLAEANKSLGARRPELDELNGEDTPGWTLPHRC